MQPICMGCKHFVDLPVIPPICAAFPKGIPAAIWDAKAEHTQPFPGDHGIRFEMRTKDGG